MKKFLLTVLICFTAFFAFAADKVDVLFTHDLHAHLEPFDFKESDNAQVQKMGGFARISTLIKKIKEEKPNILLVDAGDFSMGTLFQSIFETSATELNLMSEMGYDATTFGNHEFDFGDLSIFRSYSSMVKNRGNKYKVPLVKLANADYSNSPLNSLELPEYLILERGGVRVAIIAAMGVESQRYTPNYELTFLPLEENVQRITNKVREEEKADIVILLSHTGTHPDPKLSEDENLAKAVKGVDLIISGHSHTTINTPIKVNNTYIVSAGCYGIYLGEVNLEKNPDGKTWNLVGYTLHPIDGFVEEDKSIKKMIEDYKKEVNENYLKPYGYKMDDIVFKNYLNFESQPQATSIDTVESNLCNFLTDSLLYMYNKSVPSEDDMADIAVIPVGLIRDTYYQKDITVADVFLVNSLGIGPDRKSGYPVSTLYLTGEEIKWAVEVAVSVSKFMTSANLQFAGLRFKANTARIILNRVYDVEILDRNGSWQEVEDDKLYKVVTDLYTLKMISAVTSLTKGLISFTPKTVTGATIDNLETTIVHNADRSEMKAWSAVIEYSKTFAKDYSGKNVLGGEQSFIDGRRDIHHSLNPAKLLNAWNWVSFVVLFVIIILCAIIALLIVLIYRKIKNRRFFEKNSEANKTSVKTTNTKKKKTNGDSKS